MKNRSCQLFILLVWICTISHRLDAQTPEPEKPKEFIYVLRLVPRLYDGKNWTKEDNAVLGRHFVRFQEAIKTGQLILAGRTSDRATKLLESQYSRRKTKPRLENSWKKIPRLQAG